ncbi:MAG: hypothetical protein RML15_06690 [Bacteroidota bacterium]|nr:hypothetical protein [Candidatus Kapabacteria bacterium]MCS7303133.1 hypothetical protein [Candidatus Kapabacteria bacterium]MCX7937216.1 hypothetical protein [Chlorobiota bacterium]MDW8075699.1 hypothetical protein [Bacteroidota bacterium]MDW8272079.1 hypothetical protein [Bacteroidota bacterium]
MAEAEVKKRRRRARKYITLYSPFLMKETRHELIGEVMETEQGRMQWARCTVSRHAQLVNLDALEHEQQRVAAAGIKIERENAKAYDPTGEYSIGDVIYHASLDDYGLVRSKEIATNGMSMLVVLFEKNKEKRLVEKLAKK